MGMPDVVSMVDITPTLLDLAGIDTAPIGMDGRSFAPVLLGRSKKPRTAAMVEFYSLSSNAPDEPACKPGVRQITDTPNEVVHVVSDGDLPSTVSVPGFMSRRDAL